MMQMIDVKSSAREMYVNTLIFSIPLNIDMGKYTPMMKRTLNEI